MAKWREMMRAERPAKISAVYVLGVFNGSRSADGLARFLEHQFPRKPPTIGLRGGNNQPQPPLYTISVYKQEASEEHFKVHVDSVSGAVTLFNKVRTGATDAQLADDNVSGPWVAIPDSKVITI